MSSYHPDKVWSICQYVDGHSDLDLWPIDLKINRVYLQPETHVCAKFEEPRSILCLVMIRRRFGLRQYVDGHCDLALWLIVLKINRDHLHPKTHVCAKFDKLRSILCLVTVSSAQGKVYRRTNWHLQSNIPPLCWRGAWKRNYLSTAFCSFSTIFSKFIKHSFSGE